jgi:hypothetical protein
LTDFDAVSEAIVVPLMNSPTGSTAAGGLKLASIMVVLRGAMQREALGISRVRVSLALHPTTL